MRPPTVGTTALLREHRGGRDRARSDLIAHCCDRLRIVTRRILRDDFPRLRRWEQTDDILQNALLRLNRALAACYPLTSAHFWNLAAEQIRRAALDLARHHFGPHGDAANHHTDPRDPCGWVERAAPPSDGGGAFSMEQWAWFHEQVGMLPESVRQVFGLIWYQGLSREQTAAIIGASVKTVNRRWQNAHLLLAHALQSVAAY